MIYLVPTEWEWRREIDGQSVVCGRTVREGPEAFRTQINYRGIFHTETLEEARILVEDSLKTPHL